MNWNVIQPIAAQAARDFLRTVGMGLAAHGFIQEGAGVESFIGAGMTLAGLFWGWWTTSGYLQVGALLQKLTASHSHEEAIEKAQALPPADPATVNKTIVKAVTSVLLVAFVLSAFLAVPSAQAQTRPLIKPPQVTGDIVADTRANLGIGRPGSGLTGSPLNDLIGALDKKLLPDLEYAKKLADASGSKVTGPCFAAWIDIINTRQKAVQDAQGQDLPLPEPHIVTDFEKLVELRNSLQPDSEFMIRCSPVASMVKKDITGFIGVVISGGAGLATLVPGL